MKAKTLNPSPTEAQVTQAVLDAAAAYGLQLDRRNVGAFQNPGGRTVRCGTKGDSDYTGVVATGPNRGRRIDVELKRGDFDPRKLTGDKRDHFFRQVARLIRVNDAGGLGLWVRDGADFARFLAAVYSLPGVRVEVDADGYCWMTDDPGEG